MRKQFKHIRSNLLWNFVNEAVSRGTVFLVILYLARILGVESFGVFAFFQTIVFYFWYAADLGISVYGIREVARIKPEATALIGDLMTIRLVMAGAAFVCYVSAVWAFSESSDGLLVALSAGLYLVFYGFLLDWVLRGLERFRSLALVNAVIAAFFFTGTWLLVQGPQDTARAALIWSLSFLAGGLVSVALSREQVRPSQLGRMRPAIAHVKQSIHFSLSGVLLLINHYSPFLILSVFVEDRDLGLFFAAFRIVLALGAATTIVNMVFFPRLSVAHRGNPADFSGWLRLLLPLNCGLGLAVAIPLWLGADAIVPFLLGEEYVPSADLFGVMIWLVPLYFIRNALRMALLAAGFQVAQNLPLAMGVAVVGVTSIVLIPQMGTMGATLALLVSESVILLGLIVVAVVKLGPLLARRDGVPPAGRG